jgi:isocitrate/isopropylmalate dehydrogenase
MRRLRIAAIGGDGIGPEVIAAGCRVLAATAAADGGFACDTQDFDWGSAMYRASWKASTPSSSALSARPTSLITSRFGSCGWRSARASTNTPTSGRPGCCLA